MTEMNRRVLLKAGLAGSVVAVAAGAGLLKPQTVLAAWPQGAFEAKSVADALKNLHQGEAASESQDIDLGTPDIAENGAVVPVKVSTSLPNVESIGILIEENNRPLAAEFVLTEHSGPSVSTRVKVAKTSNIVAVVKSDGKLYSATKNVKVTIGGCGG